MSEQLPVDHAVMLAPAAIVDRFMAALKQDPDLAAVAYMAAPQLAMMRDRSIVVQLLDRAVELWAKARGGRFVVEETA